MIFPWQTAQWSHLLSLWHKKRLPHALMFSGLEGIGKVHCADIFSRILFCQQPINQLPCNQCHSCRLTRGRAHPNILWIEPEKAGAAIKVDQIRDVSEFINQTSLQGEYRVVIINPANNMNIHAANALLKTLEEPSIGALLILVADLRNRLPATILSRCQRVLFSVPPSAQALAWLNQELKDKALLAESLLQIANGAPLTALSLAKEDILTTRTMLFQAFIKLDEKKADPLKIAAELQDNESIQLIDLATAWVIDLIRLQVGIHDMINQDFASALNALQTKRALQKNQQYLTHLQGLRKQLCQGMNFNKQLLTESILLQWM
jgi:DNA polymerase-3 subunit delta'